jgi:fibronectin type 3 domain-containing protein
VRSAIASPRASIESAAAGPVCITPNDIFPPAAPGNLTAVAGTGVVSLIWDRVEAVDLAGYLVLRAEAPGDKLQPLFEKPIADTTYKDTTTVAGTRYVYAVVAVDKTANRSAESNRVEETGRN